MAAEATALSHQATASHARDGRLRKHADYQRVYREGKRQSLPLMAFFYAPQVKETKVGPHAAERRRSRVGLTVGRALGKAVDRNRIKRRMREAVRLHRGELVEGMDVVLHPRRTVLQAEFSRIESEVQRAFHAIRASLPLT